MNRINIIILSKEESSLADVASVFAAHNGFDVTWFASAEQVWTFMQSTKIDVAVVSDLLHDCTGLQFIKKLVTKNPLVNCALISSLSHDEFHEATEGYGIFMQLPVNPTSQSANDMIEHLGKISQLTR